MLLNAYVHGASDSPLQGETIGVNFDAAALRWRDREALVVLHQDVRWTYRELQEHINTFAAGLISLGLAPGERLGIWSHNCCEWVVAQYAAAKAGLILVNINPAFRSPELEYVLNTVSARALIFATEFKTSNYLSMIREIAPEADNCQPGCLRSSRLPHLNLLITIGDNTEKGMFTFSQVSASANEQAYDRLKELSALLQFDDIINIQFTSGTTGSPKGAALSHFNILNNAFFVAESMRLTKEDRLCIPVPLYHCFGMVLGTLACTTHGAAMIFPGTSFEPLSVLKAIESERCTALHGVPTMFIAELNHPRFSDFDLSSLRTGIMAGAPCPIEVMRRVVKEMHMHQVTIAYGMTETSPVSFQSSPDDSLERRVTTVGRVHPHVEAKIVDKEGHLLARGEEGELLTRGYLVMEGYWGDEERTKSSIDVSGWMHTGDLATIDQSGYCKIVGRVKDMVIRGGENIYPREIEEYLYRLEKIDEVQVFGVPDPVFGEELCAWIRLAANETADEEEIRAFCRGNLAHYKIPRYIRFVTSFPMTVTGKVQKYVMREKMVEELQIDDFQKA